MLFIKKITDDKKAWRCSFQTDHRDVINPFTADTKAMLSCISKHFLAETCFAGVKYYEYRKIRKYLYFFPRRSRVY